MPKYPAASVRCLGPKQDATQRTAAGPAPQVRVPLRGDLLPRVPGRPPPRLLLLYKWMVWGPVAPKARALRLAWGGCQVRPVSFAPSPPTCPTSCPLRRTAQTKADQPRPGPFLRPRAPHPFGGGEVQPSQQLGASQQPFFCQLRDRPSPHRPLWREDFISGRWGGGAASQQSDSSRQPFWPPGAGLPLLPARWLRKALTTTPRTALL